MHDELHTAFARLAMRVTGEPVQEVLNRKASILAFTQSLVVKLFVAESPYRTRRRYNWLVRHGNLRCTFGIVRCAGRRCAVLVMERIPDEFRLSEILAAAPDDLEQVGRLVGRLDEIRSDASSTALPADVVGRRMIENIEKQVLLLRGDELSALADRVLVAGHQVLSAPADVCWTPVVHGDLHASNVFLMRDRVVVVDPVFSEPRARSAPFFTELAPLYADAQALGRSEVVRRIKDVFPRFSESGSWPIFLLVACLKSLVQYRVARGLQSFQPGSASQPSGAWASSARDVSILVDTVLAEIAGGVADGPGRA